MVNKDKVIQWISNPSSLQASDLEDVNALLKQYGAFTSAHLFKVMLDQSPDTIKSTAVHCTDRAKLRVIVHQAAQSSETHEGEQDGFPVNPENVNAFDQLGDEEETPHAWTESQEKTQEETAIEAETEQEQVDEVDDAESKNTFEDDANDAEPDPSQPSETDEQVESSEKEQQDQDDDLLYQEAEPSHSWFDPAIQSYTETSEEDESKDEQQDEMQPTEHSFEEEEKDKTEMQTTDDEHLPQESEKSNEAEKLAESYSLPDEYEDDSHLYQYPREDKSDSTPPNPDDVKNQSTDDFETEPSWTSSQPEEEVNEQETGKEQPEASSKEDENDDFRKDLQESLEEFQQTRANYQESEEKEETAEAPNEGGESEQKAKDENGWQDLKPKETDQAKEEDAPSDKQEDEEQEQKKDDYADASFFGLNDLLSEDDEDDNPLKKK